MPENKKENLLIDISIASIFKVVGVVLLLWFIYYIQDIVIVIFVATLLAIAFNPIIDWMSKKKIPRPIGIVIIFIILFTVFFGVIALIIPPLSDEVAQITDYFPSLWSKFVQSFPSDKNLTQNSELIDTVNKGLSSLRDVLVSSTGNAFSIIRTIFGNIISFILIFVLAFYFLLQEGAIRRAIKYLTPAHYHSYLVTLIGRMQDRIGRWLRGEFILAMVVGTLILVGLRILNVKYFLALALLAGIMEVIPYIGPFFSAIPAAFIAFADSPWKGFAVIILYWVVQQLENHIIVPKVMQKAVGLNPIIIIMSVLVAAKLFGFLGVVIAVPTAAVLSVLAKAFYQLKVLGMSPQEILKDENGEAEIKKI